MSQLQSTLRALPRILSACRAERMGDADPGRGLSPRRAEILSFLDADDPTMVGELAAHSGVTASTMSLTLRRLESAGLVHRSRDPEDRRVMNVRLTPEGVRMRDAASLLDPDKVHRLLLTLSPQERYLAVEGLVALAEACDTMLRERRAHVDGLTGAGPA